MHGSKGICFSSISRDYLKISIKNYICIFIRIHINDEDSIYVKKINKGVNKKRKKIKKKQTNKQREKNK